MATALEVMQAGYAKSSKNKAGEIATEATELLAVMNNRLRKYFSFMSELNWQLAGAIVPVTYNAGSLGWPRPSNAEMVVRLERAATAQEVVVVSALDRAAEPTLPAMYRLGGVFRTVGGAVDPVTAETINFFIARHPATLTAPGQQIDTAWPTSFDDLLAWEIAMYLARKDGRQDDIAAADSELGEWTELLKAFCAHETTNERRRFGHTGKFVDSQMRRVKPAGE